MYARVLFLNISEEAEKQARKTWRRGTFLQVCLDGEYQIWTNAPIEPLEM